MSPDARPPHCPPDPHPPRVRPRRLLRLRRPGAGLDAPARSRPAPASADPLAPKPPHHAGQGASRSSSCSWPAGPSHLETFDPKPLLNKLDGQPRPKEFGEAKYQFVQRNAKLLGTRRTFQKYGQSGIEVSDLFPHTAELRRRPRRRSGPATATWSSTRPRSTSCSPAGSRPGFPSMGSWVLYGLGLGEPVAAVLRGDARPEGGAGGGPADVRQRLPAGRLPADDVPARRPAGAQPRPARRASRPTERRRTLRADPRAERGDARPGRRGVLRADQRLRPGLPDADRGARRPRPLARAAGDARPLRRSAASRRTTTAGAACWRGSSSSTACGSSASSPAAGRATCSGTPTTTSRRTTSARPPRPTSPSPACSRT